MLSLEDKREFLSLLAGIFNEVLDNFPEAPRAPGAAAEPYPEPSPEPTTTAPIQAPTVEQLQSYLATAVPVLGGQTIYQVICGAVPSGKITDLDDQGRLDVALSIAEKLEEVQG